jgi:lauroyl/myristoyl acyltransferase
VPGDRAAYLAYRAGAETARRLPAPLGRRLARLASRAMLRTWDVRRDQVRRHLERVSGSALARSELDRATAAVFENYARYWHEMFRLRPDSGARLQDAVVVEGIEHLEAAVASRRGVILALPHLGNWDLAGAWLAARIGAVTVVAEPVEPRELFDWFVDARTALGMRVVPLGSGAAGSVLQVLRQGGTVCLLCDRDITGDGVQVELFGEVTTLPGGPATLAIRSGALLLPTATYFRGDSGHGVRIEAPLEVERRGGLRDDVQRVTQDLAHHFEEMIRAAPEQWLMMQPIWPSDPSASERVPR